MAKDSHKKPVTSDTPPELTGQSQPKFNKQDFDEFVYDKGYQVHIEKALRCPCRIEANSQPLPNCKNCGGIGWFFIEKKSTRAALVAMNRTVKNTPWNETDRGTVSISLRDDDRIAFMDRITQLDLLSSYSEVCKLRWLENKLISGLIYNPKEVENVYLFEDASKKLYKLLTTDYVLDEYKIIVNLPRDYEGFKISVRYRHNPQFHVIDITREQVANRGSLTPDNNLQDPISDRLGQLPVHGIARRAHYVLDTPDLLGESLFDNT